MKIITKSDLLAYMASLRAIQLRELRAMFGVKT